MRERGFTLIELLVATTMLVTASGIVVTVFLGVAERDRVSAAYAADVRGMRAAVRALQGDLRAARSTADLDYRLEDGVLRRGGRPLLERVTSFEVVADGSLARVRLAIQPRSARAAREASLDFRVRMRGSAEEER